MGIYPAADDVGYVGWNMWLWVNEPTPQTWGPQTATVSEGGYSVTATASAEHVTWDFGNGDSVTCAAGTPWTRDKIRNEASPTCGYQYESAGEYDITATTAWRVSWSGIGRSGLIDMELTDTVPVRVAELQAVNTGG